MATNGTRLGVFEGSSVTAAFASPQNLDILQIVNLAGDKIIIAVSYSGAVTHNPTAAQHTNGTRLGVFQASDVTDTTAAIFASAFPQTPGIADNLDIFQVIAPNGARYVYHLDYTGTPHTP
jgi:hypothetical protein